MPAHLLRRFVPVAAVAAGLMAAAPPAHADTDVVKATIALGDKRAPVKAKKPKKPKKDAKKAKASTAITCQNTGVLPVAENLDAVRAAILCLHNQIRAGSNLPLLKENAKLRKAALGHSVDMVAQGYFDHAGANGDTFVDRILGAGYAKRTEGWSLGENLAWGTGELGTPDAVMQAWLNSPGHKANILKPGFREIGIGIRLGVPSDQGVGVTITADFGAKL